MGFDIGSILDLGVPGLLLIALVVIWREWKHCLTEAIDLRKQLYEDAKENAVIARALITAKQKEMDGT